eukprot:scaffold2995_cov120-Isochrysis_galbana.AAC.3
MEVSPIRTSDVEECVANSPRRPHRRPSSQGRATGSNATGCKPYAPRPRVVQVQEPQMRAHKCGVLQIHLELVRTRRTLHGAHTPQHIGARGEGASLL